LRRGEHHRIPAGLTDLRGLFFGAAAGDGGSTLHDSMKTIAASGAERLETVLKPLLERFWG
jgi:hypothetical protein